MASGTFIKLYRKILDSEFYQEDRRFSKNEAWIDILLRVDYTSGTLETTYGQLAKRWNWSKSTVFRFLKQLSEKEMIILPWNESGTGNETAITVAKWEVYQGARNGKRNESGTISEFLPITEKEDKNIYSELLFYWNQQKIIVHKEITADMIKAIDKTLKILTIEQIKTCISRYSQILKDESYFFNYQWTLIDFLNRKNGVKDFLDDGPKWVNYQNEKKTKAKPQAPRLFDELGDPIPGALDKTPI